MGKAANPATGAASDPAILPLSQALCRAMSGKYGAVMTIRKGIAGWAEKKKGQRAWKLAALNFVLSPSTLLDQLLVERVEGHNARFGNRADAGRVDANHCIFLSAETANTSLVDGVRNALHGVASIHTGDDRARARGELIAALTTVSGVAVVGQNR